MNEFGNSLNKTLMSSQGLPDVVKATAKKKLFLEERLGHVGPPSLFWQYLNIRLSLVNACGCHVFVKAPLCV